MFDDNKVAYKALDVSKDANARAEMVKKAGQLTVPVVDIDGDITVGYDEAKFKKLLNLAS